jgi:drug/metabolite transporter (DMT)-like permease
VDAALVRFLSIIAGTVLWDVGAVLQKTAVAALPATPLRVASLAGSGRWMAGLLVTAAGWGLYVFGLEKVPVSAARTITGGSYVVLAFFSIVFLRTPLRLPEWLALALVTAGILLLGLGEPQAAAAGPVPTLPRVMLGAGCVAAACAGLSAVQVLRRRPRGLLAPVVVFAALSGLLSSVGDLAMKILLSVGFTRPFLCAGLAAGLIVFYLGGFYMLSRAYQAGTMVGGIVISDFFARAGAIFLGAVVLCEPLAGSGLGGAARGVGFALVLGGSLLLGRFSGGGERA